MPQSVINVIRRVGERNILVIVIDEFDAASSSLRRATADMVKSMSDHQVPATLLLVGVGDTVTSLIGEHESVERALLQVRMPRMDNDELTLVIQNGVPELVMDIEQAALESVVSISQGLPHYTHQVGLYAARHAVGDERLTITADDVSAGISASVKNAQESIAEAHHTATVSSRSDSLYRQVALACALAKADDRGFFTTGRVREPMGLIMGKVYEIPAFAKHISQFCESKRGELLERRGSTRSYQYRFRNPLLQPYIIMHGLSNGLINQSQLTELAAG